MLLTIRHLLVLFIKMSIAVIYVPIICVSPVLVMFEPSDVCVMTCVTYLCDSGSCDVFAL